MQKGRYLLGIILMLTSGSAFAQFSYSSAKIDGAQAGTASAAAGSAHFFLNESTMTLLGSVRWQGLGTVTAIHIHGPAVPGVNAPVVIDLVNNFPAMLTVEQINDLKQGNWYVNIHTDDFPAGEIRGQIWPTSICDPGVRSRKITPSKWHLLSLPCDATPGTTWAQLLNDLDPTKWSAFRYQVNGSSGQYVPYAASDPVPAAGVGFWFISTEAVTLTLPDSPFPPLKFVQTSTPPCDNGEPCFKHVIDFQSTWNLIGNPSEQPVRHQDMQITNVMGCTAAQPCEIAAPNITSSFFLFNEFSQSYLQFNTDGAADDTPPRKSIARTWDGFWAMLAGNDVMSDWYLYSREFPSKFMFVTDGQHNGNLGGISGANAICQNEAEAGGLPGRYEAWLSDSTSSPDTDWHRSTVPYIRPDGQAIASDYPALVDFTTNNPLQNAISISPTLGRIDQRIWTNTKPNGTIFDRGAHCSNWSSDGGETRIGRSIATDNTWAAAGLTLCPNELPLYCGQQ